MTLDEFEPAQGLEGRLYELGRGTVSVVDVPHPRHLAQLTAIHRQLSAYDLANPGRIHSIATGSECKILVPCFDSERHPDLAIYKTPPPERDVWSTWVPELVIEIVSPGSEQRDYVETPEEYLAFGVANYWVIDAARGEGGEALLHRRRAGKWTLTVARPPGSCRTRQLPGFQLALTPVFTAARSAPH